MTHPSIDYMNGKGPYSYERFYNVYFISPSDVVIPLITGLESGASLQLIYPKRPSWCCMIAWLNNELKGEPVPDAHKIPIF